MMIFWLADIYADGNLLHILNKRLRSWAPLRQVSFNNLSTSSQNLRWRLDLPESVIQLFVSILAWGSDKMQRKLTKSESPAVKNAFRRKQLTRRSHAAFTWVFVNVVLAAVFFGEL